MSIRPVIIGGLLASLLVAPSAFADMGRVYISTTGVQVSEDAQKAIILHNDRDEVLILGTELHADRQTPIIRFIPFPSEPQVSLAPKGVFERLAHIVAKYKLEYVYASHSKGGPASSHTAGVEVRLSAKLGAHDLTIIKVRDAAAFRSWVNGYFKSKKLPHNKSYPKEEGIVADYVARGIDYFVLDVVEVQAAKRFVDPLMFKFKSEALYYPLKTSNSFGGKGEIELFIVAPTTLCAPGSNIFMEEGDKAINAQGYVAGDCLGLPMKASTSAMLVPEEHDLQTIYPDADAFFAGRPAFIQSIHYAGKYEFKDDILLPMPRGVQKALPAPLPDEGDSPFGFHTSEIFGETPAVCRTKPDPGTCKGRFEAYYFDEKAKSCKQFFWGGCQGAVPFETLKECENTCKPQLPKPLGK